MKGRGPEESVPEPGKDTVHTGGAERQRRRKKSSRRVFQERDKREIAYCKGGYSTQYVKYSDFSGNVRIAVIQLLPHPQERGETERSGGRTVSEERKRTEADKTRLSQKKNRLLGVGP